MNRTPSVRTWFPDEIENTLAAVNQANGAVASAVPTPEMALRAFYNAVVGND